MDSKKILTKVIKIHAHMPAGLFHPVQELNYLASSKMSSSMIHSHENVTVG